MSERDPNAPGLNHHRDRRDDRDGGFVAGGVLVAIGAALLLTAGHAGEGAPAAALRPSRSLKRRVVLHTGHRHDLNDLDGAVGHHEMRMAF
jgi:hypothetical protein